MWLIAGLGNPGPQYQNTPHNLGFRVVEAFARRRGWAWRESSRWRAALAEGEFEGERICLMKPMTFMNISGDAIVPYLEYFKIEVAHFVAITDDIALPMGKMRVRPSGTDGGHNGLASIIERLGHNEFARLRVGIDPGVPVRSLKDFVLMKMTKAYQEDADFMVEKAADCIELSVTKGVVKAANQFNGFDAREME